MKNKNIYKVPAAAVILTAVLLFAPAAQALYENAPSDDTSRESAGNYNTTLTIQIIPGTKVYKNGKTVKSSDIEISDVVTVEYYDDPSGLQAVTVNVE